MKDSVWKSLETVALTGLKELLQNEPNLFADFGIEHEQISNLKYVPYYRIIYEKSPIFPSPSYSIKIIGGFEFDGELLKYPKFIYEYIVDSDLEFVDEFIDSK